MGALKRFACVLATNWERILFATVGIVLLGNSLRLIYLGHIAEATGVFSLGIISFIYANISRFKRFKGLGFEAELWEDKQKEAEALIERLRAIVAMYTREVIIGKVKAGRWAEKIDWAQHWKLYDDFIAQHEALGQKIDFSTLKTEVDHYFLTDMVWPAVDKVRLAIEDGKGRAMKTISAEFGSPIRDLERYRKRIEQYRAIRNTDDEPTPLSELGNRAESTLKVWNDARRGLKDQFGVEISTDSETLERLSLISKLYQSRPIRVTPELIELANRQA